MVENLNWSHIMTNILQLIAQNLVENKETDIDIDNEFDLKSFSKDISLFDYQQEALKYIIAVLELYFRDKESLKYNVTGVYPVGSGPALRFLIDMADPTTKLTIIPTGQSGNFMSPHYADQAEMFINGEYRTLVSDSKKIKNGTVLVLEPKD